MAKTKKKKNAGSTRKHKHSAHKHHMTVRRYRHNPGGLSGIGPLVTNAVFVIVGALGSKLGAQIALGSNNTGLMGYGGNAVAGAALWFLADKVLKNKAAASGIVAGTTVQIMLRLLNDYTPFGSYVANLGMGDYQMQSFVTPQVLVDPMRNADIAIPAGWAPQIMAPPPAQTMTASVGKGVGGMFGRFGRGLRMY